MLDKGISPRDFGKQFLVTYTKAYLLNGLTGNAMPMGHGFVAVIR